MINIYYYMQGKYLRGPAAFWVSSRTNRRNPIIFGTHRGHIQIHLPRKYFSIRPNNARMTSEYVRKNTTLPFENSSPTIGTTTILEVSMDSYWVPWQGYYGRFFDFYRIRWVSTARKILNLILHFSTIISASRANLSLIRAEMRNPPK